MQYALDALELPCGQIIKNRFAKASMSENLANAWHCPDARLANLYQTWAQGGAGLLLTGNVMVDSNHLGELHNVVIEEGFAGEQGLKEWARHSQLDQIQTWVQINHPGKQTPKFLTQRPVAPSAIAYRSELKHMFNPPRELEPSEILQIIQKYAFAAKKCQEAGFAGVQIHGAHGYLVSQFLSPLHNQRKDEWGGSFSGRLKFLMEIYGAIREQVGPKFPIGLKLNSSDFLKGGLSTQDSLKIIQSLDQEGLDLIEISGGTYESTVMMGNSKKETSRQAYFLDFAKCLKGKTKAKVMLTGGIRSLSLIEEGIKHKDFDLAGLARPFVVYPDLVKQIQNKCLEQFEIGHKKSGISIVDKMIPFEIVWYTYQIHQISKGKQVKPRTSVWPSAWMTIKNMGLSGLKRVRAN